jgi:hypothetical protein
MTKTTTPTLEGQTILIIALASLDAGALTIIAASSSSERVHKACERLKAHAGGKKVTVKGVVIDAKDLGGIDKAVKEVGTINHLVWTSGDPPKPGANDILNGEISDFKGKRLLECEA